MSVDASFLAQVKLALRISTNSFDSQISMLIEEAILDLEASADSKTIETSTADALQTGAIIAYVSYKWYGMDVKYKAAYDDIKMKMATSSRYRAGVVADV